MSSAALLASFLLLQPPTVPTATAARPSDPLRARAEQVLAPWFARARTPGLAAAVRDGERSAIVTLGALERRRRDRPEPDAVSERTLFEIGSLTKLLTATLLARMVVDGEVRLEDPVADLLPEGWRVPAYDEQRITLLDLATHTSGLPRMPTNFRPRDPLDPYADYTEDDLRAFLAGHELRRRPGARYEYSNLGYGLLGFALSHRAGKPFERLLVERVCAPLGMHDTLVTLDEERNARFAGPHAPGGLRVKPWNLGVLAGAGGVRSTVRDLARFAAAHLGVVRTPLDGALALTRRPWRRAAKGPWMGLGWHMRKWRDDEKGLLVHHGRTGGFASAIALVPGERRGVVVLCNAAIDLGDLPATLLRALAAR